MRSALADQSTWITELGTRGKARTSETLTTGGRRGRQVACLRGTKTGMLKYTVMGKLEYFLAPPLHHSLRDVLLGALFSLCIFTLCFLALEKTVIRGHHSPDPQIYCSLWTTSHNGAKSPCKKPRATGPVLCPISGALCTFFLCPNCNCSYSKALAEIFLPEKQALSDLPGSPCF